MKIRQILYVTLSFLAVNIGLGSYVFAAPAFELKETSQEISGKDSDTGVAFHASLVAKDRVVIDLYFGTKRIHADIDYARGGRDIIRSVYQASGLPAALSRQDILACRKLGVSLTPKINSYSRHGDALTSLLNLISSAPEGYTLNFPKGRVTNEGFKSICPEIGHIGEASFTLGKNFYYKSVLVGPVCYKDPALGRCGRGGGPDFLIGWVQRFTQECLNHDECCEVSGKPPPICGCAAAFDAAEDGFFKAPDCGTTAGTWTDDFGQGDKWVITAGDSGGNPPQDFTGTVNACGTYSVGGTRNGPNISFSAQYEIGRHRPTKPRGREAQDASPWGPGGCAGSVTFTGIFDDCKTAGGTWTDGFGGSGNWHWKRTNTVGETDLLSRAKAGPRPADK
ncbi:MAG: hypothetical protein ACREDT_02935 [Methylocella sp.]